MVTSKPLQPLPGSTVMALIRRINKKTTYSTLHCTFSRRHLRARICLMGGETSSLSSPGAGREEHYNPELSILLINIDLPEPVGVQEARYRHSILWTGDLRHASLQTGHQQWPQRSLAWPPPGVSRGARVELRHTRHVSSRWPGPQTVGDSVNISSPARISRIAIKYLHVNHGIFTQY